MDILSFALGIGTVGVIAFGVIAVVAFVKVQKLTKELSFFYRENSNQFENLYRHIEERSKEVHDRIEDINNDLTSKMDSRFDKLQSKQLLKN